MYDFDCEDVMVRNSAAQCLSKNIYKVGEPVMRENTISIEEVKTDGKPVNALQPDFKNGLL